jgi:hypothetical protein
LEYHTKRNRSKIKKDEIQSLRINNTREHNQVNIANAFNDYFLNVTEKITNKIIKDTKEGARLLNNLLKYFNHPFKDIH